MGPSLVIERFEFQRGGVWYARYFKGLVTFLVGHSKAGKSTAVEALLYPLGLTTATVMPEVRSCQYLRLVFRVAGVRWQATRSGSDPRARVSLKNLDDPRAIEHSLAVTSSKATEMTAGAFVQDLLGLSAAVRGTSRAGLDEFYTTVMALRQNTIASEFLGGGKDASRVLALEVVLGLWNEELAGLEKNASETESRFRAAQSALRQFKKLRDTGALADPDSVRAECEQKQHEHQAAAGRWQKAAGALTAAVGEHGRLVALHKAADQQRRKAARQAEVVQGKLSRVMADQARTEGELAALLNPAAQDCSHCGQVLPERAPGLCPQCGLVHPGGQDRRERQIATARARSERLARKVKALQGDMTTVAQEAETAAADALAARDDYDRDHVASARTLAQSAEKEAHGLSRDVAQLKRRLQDADYISAQEVRRKEVTGRWSQFFLERLRQINPAVEAASTDPLDFTTRVKEHGDVDKTFADSSVGGSPRAATNVALLLALRDLGRVDPLARVPPLLIIDSPLAGLGATGLDQDTSLRLIDTLISIADDPSADGYACQVIAATNDPLPRPYPGVREIHINDEHRFFDHAPVHAG
ncbi:hypothetical protein [Streptomyces sp. CNS654]|uniref:hypothetical protein n=1 Tax=Streptomyces sp. CNS654 TaxID=1506995 RepID=UPI000515765A|nr:hypothetical protein [Streptomyces sp. CNS654]